MGMDIIKKCLEESGEVCNIQYTQLNFFRDKEYQYVIKCDFIFKDESVHTVIGIPHNWSRVLIDIYIEQHIDFPFIPHIDKKGKICLYELEGILVDQNLYGILLQCIRRAKKIIFEGLEGKNKLDFIEEFDSYWGQLPDVKLAKFKSCNNVSMCIVKYALKKVNRRKRESYSKYLQRSKKSNIYITQQFEDLKIYGIEESVIKNAIFINLIMDEFLFPPDFRNKITKEYIEEILSKVNLKEFKNIISKVSRDKLIVLRIQQPNGIDNYLGFFIEDGIFSVNDKRIQIESASTILPVIVNRVDKKYLMTRSNDTENVLQGKKILLIGCGSLGGYIANELTKTGIENIMLVDDDYLYEENVFRHLLGFEYVGGYKCSALQNYLEKNIPDLKISSLAEKIEQAILDENIDFNQYDMVVSAVGNHNINRWINQYIFTNKISVPVVYAWNEVLGIGSHVAYIQYGKNGCYDCFIGRNEDTMEIYDCTSYCVPGQLMIKKVGGCGSAFIPYGSTVSLKTSCICIDTIKKIFEKRYTDNMIISAKGDDYYFKKAGLRVSMKYERQVQDIVEYNGKLFKNKKCEVCGERNDNQRQQ